MSSVLSFSMDLRLFSNVVFALRSRSRRRLEFRSSSCIRIRWTLLLSESSSHTALKGQTTYLFCCITRLITHYHSYHSFYTWEVSPHYCCTHYQQQRTGRVFETLAYIWSNVFYQTFVMRLYSIVKFPEYHWPASNSSGREVIHEF